MIRWLRKRKKNDEPLVYKLVKEIRVNGCPMKANDLISWYALMYDEKVVRRELDRMAEAGIIVQETLHWSDGFSEGWITYVRLPEQSRDQLAYAS